MESENVEQKLFSYLKKEQLKKLERSNKISLGLSIVSFIQIIMIYMASTYLQFVRIDVTGYYFDYYRWLLIIDICSILAWLGIFSLSLIILLFYFQIALIINPRLDVLNKRKNFEQKSQVKELGNEYKKKISFRMLFSFFILGTLILWLNYFPRNAQLFYPFIGCNANTGICIITAEAFYPFIIIMNGFLIVFLLLFFILFYFNQKAIKHLTRYLYPEEIQKQEEKKREELKKKAKIITMDIKERKKKKLEEIREDYRRKQELKKQKKRKKFLKMVKKEKYGKKGYKKLKKKEEKVLQEDKKKEEKAKKRDKYDFT